MNVENELRNYLDYFNRRDNCLDKLTVKTEVHVHDNLQTTRSLVIHLFFVTQGC